MSDTSSTYSINIQTNANTSGIVQTGDATQRLAVVTKQATDAGNQLVVTSQQATEQANKLAAAHGKAAEAASGHAHSNSTLRLAARGANDAAFALTDLLEGNYLVAFHRAKFAAEDLGIAIRTALFPTLAIAGITLAIEALSHFATSSDHAGDGAKEAGKKIDEASKHWHGLKESVDASSQALRDSADPMAKEKDAMDKMGEAARGAAIKYDEVTEAEKKAKEAAELLVGAYDDQAKKIENIAKQEKALSDEKAKRELSEVDKLQAQGLLTGPQADAQRAAIDRKAALEAIDEEEKAFWQKNHAARGATNVARAALSQAAQKKDDAQATFDSFTPEERAAYEAAVNRAGLTPAQAQRPTDKDLSNLGTVASIQQLEKGAPLETAIEMESAVRKLAVAYSDLFQKRNAYASLEVSSREVELKMKDAIAEGAKNLPLWDARRQAVEAKSQAAQAKVDAERQDAAVQFAADQDKQNKEDAAKEREDRKKVIAQQLAHINLLPDDIEAAKQDLAGHRTTPRNAAELARNDTYSRMVSLKRESAALDYQNAGAIPDEAERQRQQDLIRERERQRRFSEETTPQQRMQAFAQDAIAGKANGATESGTQAQMIQEIIRQMQQGKIGPEGGEQLLPLLRQYLELAKNMHQDVRKSSADYAALKREVDQLNSQIRHMRQ